MNAHISHPSDTSSLEGNTLSSLLAKLTATSEDVGPAVARVALGIVMFPHGAQKALGWFGGPGLRGTMDFMTTQLNIPAVFVALAIAAELLGAIGLVTGVLSRVAAFGVATTMLVATLMVHGRTGFFMNWAGNQGGEGFEYHLLAMGLAAVVMVQGAGAWSVDGKLASRLG